LAELEKEDPEKAAMVRKAGTKIFAVSLYDTIDEDGDIVNLFVNGKQLAEKVYLLHKPTTFLLPLSPGLNAIDITALADGVGGVTLGVKTSAGDTYVPILAPGQNYKIMVKTP